MLKGSLLTATRDWVLFFRKILRGWRERRDVGTVTLGYCSRKGKAFSKAGESLLDYLSEVDGPVTPTL
ncbi:unnamed protein product [Chondrus crispus]|uniref:Uncharacterized protein n=1 Tax=Chondrus crispus TaxID=2769 RepID=R7QHP9_CHOCR|nr:unnamed protein product [Chondrus crispus]CDF38032.1 unnamed protein product [Chondrus crispus]|eukprot:XP_005717901.1 unnamed protein product [Chondrus crispus]